MVLQELYWRDLYFFNYHVNHDKMAWFYESFEPAAVHRHEDHFTFWDPDHYNVQTTEESGTATEAISPYICCGVLAIENGLADDDSDEIVTQSPWCWVKSIPLFFEIRCKLLDADDCDACAGFSDNLILGKTPPTEGFYFFKPDGYTDVLFIVIQGGVTQTIDTGLNAEDFGWVRLCAHYDGDRTVRWFVVDDVTGLILYRGDVSIAFPAHLLFFEFGIRNGSPNDPEMMFIDYIKIAQKLYTGGELEGNYR
jgi:hypothetical protein